MTLCALPMEDHRALRGGLDTCVRVGHFWRQGSCETNAVLTEKSKFNRHARQGHTRITTCFRNTSLTRVLKQVHSTHMRYIEEDNLTVCVSNERYYHNQHMSSLFILSAVINKSALIQSTAARNQSQQIYNKASIKNNHKKWNRCFKALIPCWVFIVSSAFPTQTQTFFLLKHDYLTFLNFSYFAVFRTQSEMPCTL